MKSFLQHLGIELPIIQAPMAGVSTPEMAAAVSNAGGLGSIAIGAADADAAMRMIADVKSKTSRPFNVNLFCHQPAVSDKTREAAWLTRLTPEFARYGGSPPQQLREIYQSFLTDESKLQILLETRPAVVSFHFGIPDSKSIRALKHAGIVLIATATSVAEGDLIAAAEIDAIIAQGYEAGGHRGIFNPDGPDDQLGTFPLTRMLAKRLQLPVIAAGGIMDGAGIAAALSLGATAAQLGTAFIACPESAADDSFRAALFSHAAEHTVMTRVISGRPARCLSNRFTSLGAEIEARNVPAYPIAYDAGKALHSVAKNAGEFGYGAQWAGQGAPLARSLPVVELMNQLRSEFERSSGERRRSC